MFQRSTAFAKISTASSKRREDTAAHSGAATAAANPAERKWRLLMAIFPSTSGVHKALSVIHSRRLTEKY